MGSPVNLVTYAAGTPMALGFDGDYSVIFSQAPTTPGVYGFNVHLTDTGGGTRDIPTPITVGPAAPGGATKSNPLQEVMP